MARTKSANKGTKVATMGESMTPLTGDDQRFLAAIVMSSDDAIIGKTLDGVITSWNRGAEKIYGYSAEEVLGKNISILAPPGLHDEVPGILQTVRQGKRVDNHETLRVRKDGTRVFVSLTISPVEDHHTGKLVGASTIARDITERKKFEGGSVLPATGEDHGFLAAIVQSSDDAIIGKTLDGDITSWNRGAQRIYGYSAEEVMGKNVSILAPPDLHDEVPGILQTVRQGKRVDNHETIRVRKDGSRINVSLTISPVEDHAGKLIGASTIARDITERKRFEEERLLLAAIVDSSDDAIIGMTLDGTITSWNRGAEKMLGYSAKESVSQSVRLIYPPDRPNELPEIVARMKRMERIDHYETERQRKDGALVDISLSVSPIMNDKGEMVGLSKIARDISAQKRSAQYARSLIEASLDPLVTISPEGKITDVNEATVEATGLPREDLIGSEFSNYFTDPEKAREGYRQVFSQSKVTDYALTIRHRSGRTLDVLYNASVYKNERGNVLGVFAAARDITAQKQASQYARSLIEASLDPLVTISADGKITDVNEATIRVTGVSREQLIGSDFSNYFTEPMKASEGYQQVFAKGSVTDYPLTIRHGDGRLTDVLYNASVYKDVNGNVLGVFAAARDITAQRQASQYARSLIEASLDPLVTISPDGKINDVNEATVQVTGVSREDLVRSDFSIYFTEPEEAREGYQQVFSEGFVRDYPLAIRHVSGAVTDVLYNATVYRDVAGSVQGVFAAARDTTERKKVEEQLHATSAYARSLIEASLDPLVTISPDGKITDVNHATEEITGVSRVWLIGTDFSNYFTESAKARQGYRRVFKEGSVRDYPLTLRHASGRTMDVLYNATVYKDAQGKVRGVFASARDVTTTKKTSQYARSLIEASLDPLVTISSEGKITDVNEATVQVTGVLRQQLIGTDFSNYFTEPQKAREGYEQVFKQGFVTDYPLTIRSTTGKQTEVLYNATVYKDDKGVVLGVFAAARDHSRVKQTTEALATVNKELEAFSYSVSHDLRAPLRSIDAFSKILADEYSPNIDEEGKRIITTIRGSTEEMSSLIDALLAFSRLGNAMLTVEDVDMGKLAAAAYKELKTAEPKRIIECNIQPLPSAKVDGALMRQVWMNLISNAIKFTRRKQVARIDIGCNDEGNRLIYFVRDNGTGFDPTYTDKLFRVFQRLHHPDEFEGTGIGLANVKKIVNRHGGEVWAEAKPNEGATFYFTIPTSRV